MFASRSLRFSGAGGEGIGHTTRRNMIESKLDSELVEFLKSGREFKCDWSQIEAGPVGLHSIDELEEGVVWMGTEDPDDPNFEKDGYYEIPAISLTGTCESYDPEFILLWLPDQKRFGTWDCDHWMLFVFDDATWSMIEADPAAYLDAQWNPGDVVQSRFRPWGTYPLKEGSPFDE